MPPFDSTTPDGQLVCAILAGEREVFALLVERYANPLKGVARSRLGREEAAEDVVQETFLCVLKWLHTYDSRYSFRTWLWTILLNQCSRYAQKRARQPGLGQSVENRGSEHVALSDVFTSREASPLETLLARECSAGLHALLARLPEAQADALRLRFYGDLKFQEIADALDCSLTTAKLRVKHGLLQLAEWLKENNSPLAGERAPASAPFIDGDLR